ncbi:adenylate cyclase, class I [Aggregatibacter actinomycetemcomitans serotype e str. SC1083]|uniref:Adenylate cyclase n=1 Tax=Aggregatibacter actinomycetemcomitans serotype e str. SC1083 TaxID=907488 RepID=G4ABD2_AGGAC|nr:class I adenylate cyclase [Aggregatibacter actinomycetemcomitans]EGY32473.1 adenylate cyclase, class I [Aggregatibacter actinomycetemcomitans serotype e str. SC1083]KYK75129.1 adenylate cyclase [Aggregatibacter actinomycetemcomitans serotype e str. SA3096]KYK81676.1 adenylate cyclase [Aggregatibacter actinomycetemcomitans serotype e str. SC936]KYK95617.1 adenylate cyclase [Aggregatibacter actinomycetemcomitans serotype e str. ANH9776]TYB21398.1 class I adenylate cyclase [Aggregatibacter act
MKLDLNKARKRVDYLDRLRIQRALSDTPESFQQVFRLIPLLLHFNHPDLPGYIADAPCGIVHFVANKFQQNYLKHNFSPDSIKNILKSHRTFRERVILGVYVMGSIASIAQTPFSDLDIWLCHREDLSPQARQLLQQKIELIQQWAKRFHVEINFYLMDQKRFRCFRDTEPVGIENCGSAQYMLLLDEFYRSAIRLAGKPLLWLHLAVENEADYEAEIERLAQNGELDLNDWVDFGGLGSLSANEYFGASLWQLYKGIDYPYKSLLKILLLEAYSHDYPNTFLISREFKQALLSNQRKVEHKFDAYLAMLQRVTTYLTQQKEFKRLDFVRCCFYIKVHENEVEPEQSNWRLDKLLKLTQQWGWKCGQLEHLNHRAQWKIKQTTKVHNDLIKFLMLSYRNLVNFARKHQVNASIMPQDMSILTRKLYTAFEELPGKVTLLNPQLAVDLSEKYLTFIEVKNNRRFKDGWYLVNQTPTVQGFSRPRYTEYNESLNKLVAWAYFNRLLTANTELFIASENVDLKTLRQYVTDLRLAFSLESQFANNSELSHPCEIRNLAVIVNLTQDPTRHLTEVKSSIQSSDLFSFGPNEESLVGSIDLTYRNVWNEIRTLHFEGANAILLALKVLSNKIYRGAPLPQQVQVFCYSRYYRHALRRIVTTLINKCISIQVGTAEPPKNNLLRVAGKNWQFFFEERGISLQEIHNADIGKTHQLDAALNAKVKATEPKIAKPHKYPHEIDMFASEGFLQFFFEDNANGSFNVYILDELNRIEIYRNCDGTKEKKIHEINRIYQLSGLDENENPYKIVQRDFNYPQFYQLVTTKEGATIVPFHSRLALS